MELLVSSPLLVYEGVVQFIDYVILFRKLFLSRKASKTIIALFSQYLCAFGDVSFTLIALDFIGWVDDVLG